MLDLLGEPTRGSHWAPPGLSERDARDVFSSRSRHTGVGWVLLEDSPGYASGPSRDPGLPRLCRGINHPGLNPFLWKKADLTFPPHGDFLGLTRAPCSLTDIPCQTQPSNKSCLSCSLRKTFPEPLSCQLTSSAEGRGSGDRKSFPPPCTF